MSDKHNKARRKQRAQHISIGKKDQLPTEALCQEHPDRNAEKTMPNLKSIKSSAFTVPVFTLLVAIIVAIIYFFQLLAMQNTVSKMEAQTRLSVRPWVGLDEGLNSIQTSPLQIDKDGNASISYFIRAKNYSTSPAANVWSSANLVIADDLNTAYEQQNLACSDNIIGKPDIGAVLFQGKDRVFNTMSSFTKVNLKHKNSLISVWFAGCIGYRDQFDYLCRTKFLWAFQDDTGQYVTLMAPVQAMTVSGHFVPTASGEGIDKCQIPKYKKLD